MQDGIGLVETFDHSQIEATKQGRGLWEVLHLWLVSSHSSGTVLGLQPVK